MRSQRWDTIELFVLRPGMVVSNGLFTAVLDFGNNFPGADRWLEIKVGTNTLVPRQKLTPAPYAITAGSVVKAADCSAGHFIRNTVYFTSTGNPHLRRLHWNRRIPHSVSTPHNSLFGTVPDARLSANISAAPIKSGSSTAMPERRTISSERLTTPLSTFGSTTSASCVTAWPPTRKAPSTNAPNVIGRILRSIPLPTR